MFGNGLFHLMHAFVGSLLYPVIAALFASVALAIWESGLAIGERLVGLRRLRERGDLAAAERVARRRIERVDILARLAPILGVMGTLIPLGPGLAAMSEGDLATLSRAVITAFDTTVMGLLAGAVAYVIGRLRRRWYDALLDELAPRR